MYFSVISFQEFLIFLYGLFQKMFNVSLQYSFKCVDDDKRTEGLRFAEIQAMRFSTFKKIRRKKVKDVKC